MVPPVLAQDYITPVEVETDFAHYKVVDIPQNSLVFEGAGGVSWMLFSGEYYTTAYSEDEGSTWTVNSTLTDFDGYLDEGGTLDFYFDGTYVHLFRNAPAGWAMVYRRGIFNSDKSITWSAAAQTMINFALRTVDSVVDSSGYAYLGGSADYAPKYTPVIIKNTNTDGTWSTAGGYPKSLSGGWSNSDGGAIYTQLEINSTDAIYCLWSDFTGADGYLYMNTLVSDTAGTYATITGSLQDRRAYNFLIDPLDQLHIVYLDTSNDIQYVVYNGTDFIENRTIAAAQSTSTPIITLETNYNDLYISWFESALYTVRFASASGWETEVQVTDTITDFYSNLYVNGANFADGNITICYLISASDYDLYAIPLLLEQAVDDSPEQVEVLWLWFTDRIPLWMGLGGVCLLVLTPLFIVKAFKDEDWQGFAVALLCFGIIGFCLVVGFLYG